MPNLPAVPKGHVYARGTARRLRALTVAGWPTLPVSRLTGIPVADLERTRDRREPRPVPVWFARRVAEAYDLISSLDPARVLPATPAAVAAIDHARQVAAAAGWVYSPHDWEGVDIDHRSRTPEHADERGHLHRRETTAEEVLDLLDTCASTDRVRRAWDRTPTAERIRLITTLSYRTQWPGGPYLTAAQIGERLGITDRAVCRVRQQAGIRITDMVRAKVPA